MQNRRETTQAAAERRVRHGRLAQDDALGLELALGASANQDRLQTEFIPEGVTDFGPARRGPILRRLARGDDDWGDRPVELRDEFALPRTFLVVPGTERPLRFTMWNA